MLRPIIFFAAISFASFAPAQVAPPSDGPVTNDCRVRVNANPTAWIIQGYDPFGGTIAEGTFSVTFTNEGSSECRFFPAFRLEQPPFGLSRGNGRRIGYALLNLTGSQDLTPHMGRSNRSTNQPDVVLTQNQSRTMLFKLVVDQNDVTGSGTYSQDVVLEAQDSRFVSTGGTRIALGLSVLPSARLGLSGAYTVNDGQAVVELGELRRGVAPVPLQLRVNSTGNYTISVTSANAGRLRLGTSGWYVPYSLAIGPTTVQLAGTDVVTGPAGDGLRQEALALRFTIGDVTEKRAGTYSDVLTVSVAAR
ncbi:MAG TPA: hypothetical protein VEZ48_06845 [Sphingomonadaceae bacterium]|nr:hypothetical protein [Sphingomonadaceae bacterium]